MNKSPEPEIHGFFDEATNAVSYNVADPVEKSCADIIIPPIQINMNTGHFPKADKDGNVFLKAPVNQL